MSVGIIIPSRYTSRKPPLGAKLDCSYPLSRGLVGCWLMNEGGGRASNIAINNLNPLGTWRTTPGGIGMNAISTAAGGRNWNSDIKSSYVFLFWMTTSTVWGGLFSHSSIIHELNPSNYNASSQYYYRRQWSGATPLWRSIPSWAFIAGKICQLTITYDGSSTTNSPIFYIGKTVVASFLDGAAPSGTLTTTSGTFSMSTGNTVFLRVLRYNRIISPSEIKELSEAPYRFLRPVTRKFYSLPSGGDVTVTPDAIALTLSPLSDTISVLINQATVTLAASVLTQVEQLNMAPGAVSITITAAQAIESIAALAAATAINMSALSQTVQLITTPQAIALALSILAALPNYACTVYPDLIAMALNVQQATPVITVGRTYFTYDQVGHYISFVVEGNEVMRIKSNKDVDVSGNVNQGAF